jgi:hypothetical protein
MKRNEAVELLREIVLEHMNCQCCDSDEKMFSTMLKEIQEKIGMEPPRLPEDECQALMRVYYSGYTFNQWDEDFEKDEEAVKAKKDRPEAQERRLARVRDEKK